MPSPPLEEQIAEAERTVVRVRESLSGTATAFISEAKALLPDVFHAKMKKAIADYPNQVHALGAPGLSKVKHEFNAFISSIPSLVDNAMPPLGKWPHEHDASDATYEPSGRILNDPAHVLAGKIRDVWGPFGALLLKHRLATSGQHDEWEVTGGQPRYRFNVGLPKRLEELESSYSTQFRHYRACCSKLRSLQYQRSQRDAEALWDQA